MVQEQVIKASGRWIVEHVRNGNVIGKYDVKNLVVDVGLNKMLDVMFDAVTQITAWYIGLISSSGYTAIAAADTMSSHAGWTEFTAYSEGTRVAWDPATAASKSITSNAVAEFTISSSGTVKGLFLTSGSAKSGTTGTLWCATLFPSDVPVVSSDVLRVTYTTSLST